MKANLLASIFFLMSIMLVPCIWAEPDIVAGKWEITVLADRVDDGPTSMPRVFSCCLSEDDLIPLDPGEIRDCKFSEPEVNGDLIVYQRFCQDKDGRALETLVELQFAGNILEGYLHTIIDDPKNGISDLTESMSGELKGPCAGTTN